MTPNSIIAQVRPLIQDSRQPYRYTDDTLLGFINQTLLRMAILRPDLFAVVEVVDTQPGTTNQALPLDGLRLIEVFNVEGGTVINEVNRQALDQNYPGWRSAPPGSPVNYIRHVRNPAVFFLYPAPTEAVRIVIEYARTPKTYTLSETIDELADAYLPVIVDGTVFMAESVDNEHVNSNRAQVFEERFNRTLSAGLQVRAITDTEASGQDPRQVV